MLSKTILSKKTLPNTNQGTDERVCPKCGQQNACQNLLAQKVAETKELSCWCTDFVLSDEQQKTISQYGESQCCLCAKCIQLIVENQST